MITPVSLWSESIGIPLLSAMTIIPLAAMIGVVKLNSIRLRFGLGHLASLLNLALSLYLLLKFDDNNTGIQFAEHLSLFGLNYSVGVDGLNILFVPLICCSAFLALIYLSATRSTGNGRLIACVLGYEAILIAAFCALNVLQF